MKKDRAEIVKSGTWQYDSQVIYEAWIVRQNFEYYYDQGFDEKERLNQDGEVYALLSAKDGKFVGGGVSEFLSLDAAIAAAERAIQQGLNWDDHRLQPLFDGRRYLLEEFRKEKG